MTYEKRVSVEPTELRFRSAFNALQGMAIFGIVQVWFWTYRHWGLRQTLLALVLFTPGWLLIHLRRLPRTPHPDRRKLVAAIPALSRVQALRRWAGGRWLRVRNAQRKDGSLELALRWEPVTNDVPVMPGACEEWG